MKLIKNPEMIRKLAQSSGYREQFSGNVLEDSRLFFFHSSEYIVKEGAAPEFLFYLCSGRAKLYLTHANGKVSLIDFFEPPCFIGERELISDAHEPRDVQALKDCYLFALPAKKFREPLLRDPRFLRNVCLLLEKKNQRNIITASRNLSFPLSNRLAAFLLMAADHGIVREKHVSTAEYLGVSYRHLLYVLADFSKRGYIKKENGGYRITGREALLRLAKEMDPEWEL